MQRLLPNISYRFTISKIKKNAPVTFATRQTIQIQHLLYIAYIRIKTVQKTVQQPAYDHSRVQ